MASRVNVKFVVILSVVLGFVFIGVAGAAYIVVAKSASALAAKGDAAVEQGDFSKAAFLYSKAVAKDQSNLEYLEKWRDALLQKIPETQVEFRTDYSMYVSGILHAIANLKRTDVDAYHEYLGKFLESGFSSPFNRGSWETMVERTNNSIRQWAVYDDENNLTPKNSTEDNYWQTLRRYSGIALVTIMNERLPLKDHEIVRAREDLEAAIEADSEDTLAIHYLGLWYFNKALDADKAADRALASELRAEGLNVIEQGLQELPGDPSLLLRRVAGRIDVLVKGANIDPSASQADKNALYAKLLASLKGDLDEAEQALLGAEPGNIDAAKVQTFDRLARYIDPTAAQARTDRLIDKLLQADPADFGALMLRAVRAEERADFETAVASLEAIDALPPLPIGIKGSNLSSTKRTSLIKLVHDEAALAAQLADADGPNPEHLANAIKYRDRLREILSEGHYLLQLADAKIKIAQNDLNGAQRLLIAYNRATESRDPETMLMAAEIAERANQLGDAEQMYKKILDDQPTNTYAMLKLSSLYLKLEQYDLAADELTELLDIQPENAAARERLDLVHTLMGSAKSDDPVIQAAVEADSIRLGRGGKPADPERALAHLQNAIARLGPDLRLLRMAAQLSLALGQTDEAERLVDLGLEEYPDNEELKRIKVSISASDSLDATLAYIDTLDVTDLQKLVGKYSAALRFGEVDRADEFLDQAIAINPTSPGVVEQSFYRALRRKDFSDAARLVKVAEANDTDRANGLTFRARLLNEQGDREGARQALLSAVTLGTANGNTWRFLGSLQWELGDREGAVKSYAEAMRINPNDPEIIGPYLVSLAQLGQKEEALRVARTKQVFVGRDPRLLDLFLALEGDVGDKKTAISGREAIRAQDPDNRANLIALADLYVDVRNMDAAVRIIDPLRSMQDSVQLVELDARVRADSGDLAGAVAKFNTYFESIPEAERTSVPLIALGQFLIDRGRVDDGISAMRRACEYPEPNEAQYINEVVLADHLMRRARYEEALESLRAAMRDHPGQVGLHKRLALLLISLDRLEEAELAIAELGAVAEDDLELMMIRADIARARGETRQMREILDRAVATHRDQPYVYLRRAEALKSDPRLTQDVLQDLDSALKLRPGYAPALQLRALIYFTLNREEAGIDDLKAAVRENPMQDSLRSALMAELIKRNRAPEAQNVANDAVKSRPGDRNLMVGLGDVFAANDQWGRAVPYYAEAWRLLPDAVVLERYAESLLKIGRTDDVQQLLATPGIDVDKSAALLMTRARMYSAQGDTRSALTDAAKSLDLLPVNGPSQETWLEKIRGLFPRDNPQALVSYLVDLGQTRLENPWLGLFAARIVAAGNNPDAIQAMNKFATHEDPEVRFAALAFLSDLHLRAGRDEEAANAMTRALEIHPDNVLINNNLAFLLADRLGRPREALPYAEAAAKAAPDNVNILETYAATYQALNRLDEARSTAEEALRISINDSDRATVLVRLVRIALDAGNRSAALDHLEQLRTIMNRNPQIRENFQERFDVLEEQTKQ
jgi:tetratricopeptide (TPR) repeat protein